MKGDFSFLAFDTEPHYSGVLHQQGRVLLDRDWNEAAAIAARWRSDAGRDTFGETVLAVPAADPRAFKLLGAKASGGAVTVELDAGRAWADGLSLRLDAPASFVASYFGPPWQSPAATASTITADTRDLVVLDVWVDTVNGFQDPVDLIEPALGGPDTTERTQAFANLRLLRLGPNEDCSAVARLVDDFGAKGKLTVSPAPQLTITGDCPVEAGGGYTGLEHYLYRIEIAAPDGAGRARFKWSQWNGGLVGRGIFAAGVPGAGTVTVTANDQMIDHCGLGDFYLEALDFDPSLGDWRVTLSADATLSQDGVLALANVDGVWPGATGVPVMSGFFRLWNGIAGVADFPIGGANPVELKDGIRLEFDAVASDGGNYQPGDYWTFPVRASGAAFEPPVWPLAAPPQGVHHHRVALGILAWSGPAPVSISYAAGQIDDCRRIFRPLTNQKVCCTFNVGDGRTSHGDFDSIEEALQNLPVSGGEICLLPGLHTTNAVIDGLHNVKVKGCDAKTKVIPRKDGAALPIFTIRDSKNVSLEHMDIVTLGGAAIVVDARKPGGTIDLEIAHNRILACTNAIRARNVQGAAIHHNRIRMLDKRGSDVAIYFAGDDGLIERNDIRLVPALSMPPLTVPTEPDPVDPNDPCAKLEAVYVNPRLFVLYINAVWAIELPLLILLVQPYRALGGIQLGGGCERVRVLENTVVGGVGNGVTLGASFTPPPEPDHLFTLQSEAQVQGRVLDASGKPLAGVQITLTDTATNVQASRVSETDGSFKFGSVPATFRVSEGEPDLSIAKLDLQPVPGAQSFMLTITLKAEAKATPADSGFLYDIAIERNRIAAMGLSGIGVVAATAEAAQLRTNALVAASNQFGTPVVALAIRGNHISGCLLNPFDGALRSRAAVQGLGGISLGLCEKLVVTDNRIESNGVSGENPVCGLFARYVEEAEITHNRIVDNGPLTPNVTTDTLIDGVRGGIVLLLVSNFNLLDAQAVAQGETFSQRPAARIHDNLVDQPVGLALYAIAFGPLQCNDNAFSSELSGLRPLERAVGTILVNNLGGVAHAPAGIKLQCASQTLRLDRPPPSLATGTAPAPAVKTTVSATPSAIQATKLVLQRAAAVETLLPAGAVMFNDNQVRTGQSNTSATGQLIHTLDDLAYQDNQSFSLRSGNLFGHAVLSGDSLRVTGNRMSERGAATLLSLWTFGTRLNNTSFNQTDHCIVATSLNAAMPALQLANQILDPGVTLCGGRNQIATQLFKP